VASFVLIYLAAHAVQSVWNYFTIYNFNWSKKMVGLSLGFVGLLIGLVQGLLTRVVVPKFGNQRSVIFGLLFYTLGLVFFAFATQGWMMFVFLVPYCLGGIAGPALQSIITSEVPANEQGELQGALTSLMSVTSIFGPWIMTSVFAFFTSKQAPFHFPGAHFMLGAVFMLSSTVLAWLNFKKENKRNEAALESASVENVNDISTP
jgi:DHA1 family tetracycline resistance protein-like MFS transporter